MTSVMLCQICKHKVERQALNARTKRTVRCSLREFDKCTTWRKYSCGELKRTESEYLAELQDRLGVSRHSVAHVAYKKRGIAAIYLE